jgi:hypothetical protein
MAERAAAQQPLQFIAALPSSRDRALDAAAAGLRFCADGAEILLHRNAIPGPPAPAWP